MVIEQVFDNSKDIRRHIEKVITYAAEQEERLQAEVSEYVVTDSIEDQMASLLRDMQHGLSQGAGSEIGVWVSGFYGSGKSSFTKYLGFALDADKTVGGIPFLKLLQNRLKKAEAKALLNTITSKYPAVVVMLDLASEMIAGATMKEVSTVLFYKVLQWAGYSQNLKVAALERKLEKDGRYEEFKKKVKEQIEVEWQEVQNDPLVIDSVVPQFAHDLYPKMFSTATSFSGEAGDFIQFENDRVTEMIEIVRNKSGKDFVIFIIDEVGQYVGSRDNLIQNLDGLAKNIKEIGQGRVWLMGTAQQTLTEDDPRAALNSPELFKLNARFPLNVDLQPQDIKEICYTRLLGKSTEGKSKLKELYNQYGQTLRQSIKLENADFFDTDLPENDFIDFYPFLPCHFEILLQLLGALAKFTGGYGLRSAIKVIQDTLIESFNDNPAAINRDVGWLANLVTMYEVLDKDVQRAYPSIHNSVSKVGICFPASTIHQAVARAVALLQILDVIPATAKNIAALIHADVSSNSVIDEVENAVQELVQENSVPFGLQDDRYRFFSEKISDIEKERSEIIVKANDKSRIRNESLREIFTPMPSIKLQGSLSVSAGLKTIIGSSEVSLAGERESVQLYSVFASSEDYNTRKSEYQTESPHRLNQNNIYLLIRDNPELNELAEKIFRSQEIVRRHRSDPDQEVRQYCDGQNDLTDKLSVNLSKALSKEIYEGSFIFRGQTTAVSTLGQNPKDAAKKQLQTVAGRVYDRYAEAPVRAETSLAEKFLRASDLQSVTSQIDPLSLVKIDAGTASIDIEKTALVSVKEWVEQNGNVQGRMLLEHFSNPPFGWSQDTVRYIVAALLVAGVLKLNVSGKSVTLPGQQAIDALKSNNAFKSIGVSMQVDQPGPEQLALAARRLTELSGDQVMPTPAEIGKASFKLFSSAQSNFSYLPEKLRTLQLVGDEKVESLLQELNNSLSVDCSDAVTLLGAQQSSLFDTLTWSKEVKKTLKNGMDKNLLNLQEYIEEINSFPDQGILGDLKSDTKEKHNRISPYLSSPDFYKHGPDIGAVLLEIEQEVSSTVTELIQIQKKPSGRRYGKNWSVYGQPGLLLSRTIKYLQTGTD